MGTCSVDGGSKYADCIPYRGVKAFFTPPLKGVGPWLKHETESGGEDHFDSQFCNIY